MRIVGRDKLHEFAGAHADARSWLESWLAEVQVAAWADTHDIRARYVSASFIGNNVVIFNVRGNNYRLEVTVAFKSGVVSINWIGTHAEYDQRNKKR